MQEKLIFVISPPRSGSTLLQRLLGSHSQIFTHPEPHMITPMAYLGYYDTVDKAPYDHINAAEAIRAFVENLPNKEADYLDALRGYSDTMYGRMLVPSGRNRFLDKTPAYALVHSFLTKLYPRAKYVVLTRHPFAIMSSYANSFFNGDWYQAQNFNPVLERYVPAMAKLLREPPESLLHVSYENLVVNPDVEFERLCSFLELEHQPDAVNYGNHFKPQKGMGDPYGVEKHSRPVTDSLEKWVNELGANEKKLELAKTIARQLNADDLRIWGYPKESLFDGLQKTRGGQIKKYKPKTPWNSYGLQRRVLLSLKKDIHARPLGRVVRKVRYYCDVLLRE